MFTYLYILLITQNKFYANIKQHFTSNATSIIYSIYSQRWKSNYSPFNQ